MLSRGRLIYKISLENQIVMQQEARFSSPYSMY